MLLPKTNYRSYSTGTLASYDGYFQVNVRESQAEQKSSLCSPHWGQHTDMITHLLTALPCGWCANTATHCLTGRMYLLLLLHLKQACQVHAGRAHMVFLIPSSSLNHPNIKTQASAVSNFGTSQKNLLGDRISDQLLVRCSAFLTLNSLERWLMSRKFNLLIPCKPSKKVFFGGFFVTLKWWKITLLSQNATEQANRSAVYKGI